MTICQKNIILIRIKTPIISEMFSKPVFILTMVSVTAGVIALSGLLYHLKNFENQSENNTDIDITEKISVGPQSQSGSSTDEFESTNMSESLLSEFIDAHPKNPHKERKSSYTNVSPPTSLKNTSSIPTFSHSQPTVQPTTFSNASISTIQMDENASTGDSSSIQPQTINKTAPKEKSSINTDILKNINSQTLAGMESIKGRKQDTQKVISQEQKMKDSRQNDKNAGDFGSQSSSFSIFEPIQRGRAGNNQIILRSRGPILKEERPMLKEKSEINRPTVKKPLPSRNSQTSETPDASRATSPPIIGSSKSRLFRETEESLKTPPFEITPIPTASKAKEIQHNPILGKQSEINASTTTSLPPSPLRTSLGGESPQASKQRSSSMKGNPQTGISPEQEESAVSLLSEGNPEATNSEEKRIYEEIILGEHLEIKCPDFPPPPPPRTRQASETSQPSVATSTLRVGTSSSQIHTTRDDPKSGDIYVPKPMEEIPACKTSSKQSSKKPKTTKLVELKTPKVFCCFGKNLEQEPETLEASGSTSPMMIESSQSRFPTVQRDCALTFPSERNSEVKTIEERIYETPIPIEHSVKWSGMPNPHLSDRSIQGGLHHIRKPYQSEGSISPLMIEPPQNRPFLEQREFTRNPLSEINPALTTSGDENLDHEPIWDGQSEINRSVIMPLTPSCSSQPRGTLQPSGSLSHSKMRILLPRIAEEQK